jgi:hypothetical protein
MRDAETPVEESQVAFPRGTKYLAPGNFWSSDLMDARSRWSYYIPQSAEGIYLRGKKFSQLRPSETYVRGTGLKKAGSV